MSERLLRGLAVVVLAVTVGTAGFAEDFVYSPIEADGGAGQDGEDVSETIDIHDILPDADHVVVNGGVGGSPSATVAGGDGGDVRLEISNSTQEVVQDPINITVNGGAPGVDYPDSQIAVGSGGDATVSVSPSIRVGDIVLNAGGLNTAHPELGGGAAVAADDMVVYGNITLNGNAALAGGGVNLDVSNLVLADRYDNDARHDIRISTGGGFNTDSLTVGAGQDVYFNGIDSLSSFNVGNLDLRGDTLLYFGKDVFANGLDVVNDIRVSGSDNVIYGGTGITANTLRDGAELSFDFTGVYDNDTMLFSQGIGFTSATNDKTNLNLLNAGQLHYSDSVMLLNSVSPDAGSGFTIEGQDINFDGSATVGEITDGDVTIGYKAEFDHDSNLIVGGDAQYGAKGIGLRVFKYITTGDSSLFEDVTAQADDIFVVGGNLTLEDGAGYSIEPQRTRALNSPTFKAGSLTIEGASTLDFTGATAGTSAMGADDGFYLGNIVLADGADLTVAGSRNLTDTVSTTDNFTWEGALTTTNSVTITGLDLSGANVNTNINSNYTGGSLITDGSVTGDSLTLDGDMTLNLNITADESVLTELAGSTLNVKSGELDDTVTIGGDGKLEEAVNLGVSDPTSTGGAYNTLLAAPAMVSLVNGGGDAVEKAAGSFSPSAFGSGSFSATQFGAFASMGGGHTEVETGSGIESDDFHLLVGPGLRVNSGTGRTDFGAFFEAGWGSYDAYSAVHVGNGDSSYYGGGLLLRHDTCSGLYGEASVRFGRAESEFNSIRASDFDLESGYFGGHLGVGYIFSIGERATVDFFAKGLLTRVGGDSAEDESGNTIDIDATNSLRSQLGAKYSYTPMSS